MAIEMLAKTRVAYMRQVGPYGPELEKFWQRFNKWIDRRKLLTEKSVRYGLSLDNPMTTPPEQCRYDACIAVDEKFDVDMAMDPDVQVKTLEGGEYWMEPFDGPGKDIGAAFEKIFNQSIPKSGKSFDYRREVLERYVGKNLTGSKPGTFRCDLGVPVK